MQAITVLERAGYRTHYSAADVGRIVEACRTELAINFDVPAVSILGAYGAKLGTTADGMRRLLRVLLDD